MRWPTTVIPAKAGISRRVRTGITVAPFRREIPAFAGMTAGPITGETRA